MTPCDHSRFGQPLSHYTLREARTNSFHTRQREILKSRQELSGGASIDDTTERAGPVVCPGLPFFSAYRQMPHPKVAAGVLGVTTAGAAAGLAFERKRRNRDQELTSGLRSQLVADHNQIPDLINQKAKFEMKNQGIGELINNRQEKIDRLQAQLDIQNQNQELVEELRGRLYELERDLNENYADIARTTMIAAWTAAFEKAYTESPEDVVQTCGDGHCFFRAFNYGFFRSLGTSHRRAKVMMGSSEHVEGLRAKTEEIICNDTIKRSFLDTEEEKAKCYGECRQESVGNECWGGEVELSLLGETIPILVLHAKEDKVLSYFPKDFPNRMFFQPAFMVYQNGNHYQAFNPDKVKKYL